MTSSTIRCGVAAMVMCVLAGVAHAKMPSPSPFNPVWRWKQGDTFRYRVHSRAHRQSGDGDANADVERTLTLTFKVLAVRADGSARLERTIDDITYRAASRTDKLVVTSGASRFADDMLIEPALAALKGSKLRFDVSLEGAVTQLVDFPALKADVAKRAARLARADARRARLLASTVDDLLEPARTKAELQLIFNVGRRSASTQFAPWKHEQRYVGLIGEEVRSAEMAMNDLNPSRAGYGIAYISRRGVVTIGHSDAPGYHTSLGFSRQRASIEVDIAFDWRQGVLAKSTIRWTWSAVAAHPTAGHRRPSYVPASGWQKTTVERLGYKPLPAPGRGRPGKAKPR